VRTSGSSRRCGTEGIYACDGPRSSDRHVPRPGPRSTGRGGARRPRRRRDGAAWQSAHSGRSGSRRQARAAERPPGGLSGAPRSVRRARSSRRRRREVTSSAPGGSWPSSTAAAAWASGTSRTGITRRPAGTDGARGRVVPGSRAVLHVDDHDRLRQRRGGEDVVAAPGAFAVSKQMQAIVGDKLEQPLDAGRVEVGVVLERELTPALAAARMPAGAAARAARPGGLRGPTRGHDAQHRQPGRRQRGPAPRGRRASGARRSETLRRAPGGRVAGRSRLRDTPPHRSPGRRRDVSRARSRPRAAGLDDDVERPVREAPPRAIAGARLAEQPVVGASLPSAAGRAGQAAGSCIGAGDIPRRGALERVLESKLERFW
jgi:hypothetical protein